MGEQEKKATVEELLLELGTTVRSGFAKVNADVALVANDLGVVKGRLGVVEERQNDFDTWRKSNSERVRGLVKETTSNADLSHESKLADEISARKSLEEKVDASLAILARIDGLLGNRFVKHVFTAIGAAIVTWLATKGVHIP